ncbi:MAG: tRNA (guanosine(37)-N1)-methyltransferase TrmD [Acutalibacteraceae bacterium]|nr:tRNA (guanosine(37)-N1)-methyltransferase TrmD [Acutalibacteraceae bacterium]
MRIDIMTLFPEMCERVLDESIIGRSREGGLVEINCVNIRDYSTDKHRRVDDTTYGGGTGMIMQCQPIFDCFCDLEKQIGRRPYLIYMSPQGKKLDQQKVKELAKMDNIAILCGHYEGVDERVIEELVDEEISIGDYVLTGGELPALVLADSITRMLPGVLASDEAFEEESHYNGLLEYPQYTRPYEWHGKTVPDVLLTGHHANITKWRRERSLERTMERRPDLLGKAELDRKDLKFIQSLDNGRKK